MRDRTEADDLVHDVVLRALDKLHLWCEGTNMRTWLFTIMHNLHANEMRRRSRMLDVVPLDAAAPRAEAAVEWSELSGAMAGLSGLHRQVLLLDGLEGMTYAEAAGGWMVRGETETTQQLASAPPIDTQELMVRASMAHVVSHEDELRSASNGGTAAVGDYLADRMGKPVKVPSLTSFGYRLVGSRVLPDTNGPAAQFVFSDESGKKVSLYVRGEEADGVNITYALADDLSMFYWNDSDRSYAMVTRVDDEQGREALLTAAKAVYGQFRQ